MLFSWRRPVGLIYKYPELYKYCKQQHGEIMKYTITEAAGSFRILCDGTEVERHGDKAMAEKRVRRYALKAAESAERARLRAEQGVAGEALTTSSEPGSVGEFQEMRSMLDRPVSEILKALEGAGSSPLDLEPLTALQAIEESGAARPAVLEAIETAMASAAGNGAEE